MLKFKINPKPQKLESGKESSNQISTFSEEFESDISEENFSLNLSDEIQHKTIISINDYDISKDSILSHHSMESISNATRLSTSLSSLSSIDSGEGGSDVVSFLKNF